MRQAPGKTPEQLLTKTPMLVVTAARCPPRAPPFHRRAEKRECSGFQDTRKHLFSYETVHDIMLFEICQGLHGCSLKKGVLRGTVMKNYD